jgi:hypothetical protein
MKRLVDETTDELARSLLVAGIEHRPPAGNKAQVIVALGAGGTLGLFSSNAFAWLGTTAGKVTAAGVAVGVASAMFIAGPQLLSSEPAPQASVVSSGAVAPGAVSSGVEREQASAARVADADEAVARGASEDVVSLGAGEAPGSRGDAVTSSASGSGKTATKKLATWRERRLAARRRAALAKEAEREGAESSAEVASASEPPPAAPETSDGHDLLAAKADLDSEVKLVDDMHWAARHNDHVALGRFLERYRATFPDGQLKKEVAQFAARLERSTTSPR